MQEGNQQTPLIPLLLFVDRLGTFPESIGSFSQMFQI